jgi:hypothetical protein
MLLYICVIKNICNFLRIVMEMFWYFAIWIKEIYPTSIVNNSGFFHDT